MLDLVNDTTTDAPFAFDLDAHSGFPTAEGMEMEFMPRGIGNHRLAEVVDGELDLIGLPGRVASRFSGLHRRIAAAVVEDLPRPIECAGLSGAEELIHQIESDWRECGRGFPTDPDVPGWIDVLVDRTRCRFVEWCFRLLRTIGRGTVERIESIEPGCGGIEQVWSTAEPEFLADDLISALEGRGQAAMHDPLLVARRIPA